MHGKAEEAFSRARTPYATNSGKALDCIPALMGSVALLLGTWIAQQCTTRSPKSCWRLAGRGGDHGLLLQAHHAAWATAFSRGDLTAAMAHTKAGVRPLRPGASTRQWPRRLATTTQGYVAALFRARALALLGRTAEATRTSSDAIVLARVLAQPLSQGVGAGVRAAAVDQVRRDARGGKSTRSSRRRRSRGEQDFRLMLAWATAFEGWAGG